MLVTGAHSSRVKKSKAQQKPSLLRRSTSSPFSSNPRRKPSSSSSASPSTSTTGKPRSKSTSGSTSASTSTSNTHDASFDEPLSDTGIIASLATDLSLRDVAQFIINIRSRMFDPVPDRGSGMSSTRIAEVYNYRRSLPPIVTVAHVHALCRSITQAEREMVELAREGVVRRIRIPNRGVGAENVGEGVVLVKEWEELVRGHGGLEEDVKDKYLSLLKSHPTSLSIPSSALSSAEAQALAGNGFLTTPTNLKTNTVDIYSRPGSATLGSITSLSSVGSKAASGTLDAVGGSDVFTSSGASGGATVYSANNRTSSSALLNFALPNTGPYLKLVVAARAHLVQLLSKASRYKEAPLSLLREKWDGGVMADDAASMAKKTRGEFTGVLPGRTKKWKQFYGLRFEWVLEECVGAGMVECFETGSVGLGVRAL